MTAWLPALVGVILGGVALEAAALAAYHRRTGRGPAPRDLLPNLAAGACLLATVLAALLGAPWMSLPALLLAAGLAHLTDLRRRWPRLPATPRPGPAARP